MGPCARPSPAAFAEQPRRGATHQITSSRHRPSSSSMSTAESGERRHVSASPAPGARRRRVKSCCWGAPDPSTGSTGLRDGSSPTHGAQAGRTRDCQGRQPRFTAGQPRVAQRGRSTRGRGDRATGMNAGVTAEPPELSRAPRRGRWPGGHRGKLQAHVPGPRDAAASPAHGSCRNPAGTGVSKQTNPKTETKPINI